MEAMEGDNQDDFRARVPFATVLASIVGLWLCYFLLTTLRWELLDLGFSQELLLPRAIACLAGVAITLALWLVLRLFDTRPLWAKIAAALILSLPVAVTIAQSNQLIMADVEKRLVAQIATGDAPSVGGGGDVFVDTPTIAPPAGTTPRR